MEGRVKGRALRSAGVAQIRGQTEVVYGYYEKS